MTTTKSIRTDSDKFTFSNRQHLEKMWPCRLNQDVDFKAMLNYYMVRCSFTIWGRNGFDGDTEAQVAYRGPVGS